MGFSINENRFIGILSICFFAVGLIFGAVSGMAGERVKTEFFMHKGGERPEPATVFTPHDKIVLYTQFFDLEPGDYTFQVEWINPFNELQDSSRHAFYLENQSPYAVESWLKMTKAGFLTQLFSASESTGYNVKFYGKWQVKIYLNGELMGNTAFTVN